ncbi:MAG: DnaJ domain-containing protein, partial [Deltaproteobacteria bacterium]|nr:DnaJ domain-containing protein [Deltaproteobacteria bacterium]
MIENMKDYYKILDIPSNANQTDIEKAYQKLKNLVVQNSISLYSILPSREKETFLCEVEEAYKVLINPDRRYRYDISLRGDTPQKENERETEFVKQLSFGFAREAFTYLNYTRKTEKVYDEAIDRIRNDYRTRSEGLSIRIIDDTAETQNTSEKTEERQEQGKASEISDNSETIAQQYINKTDNQNSEESTESNNEKIKRESAQIVKDESNNATTIPDNENTEKTALDQPIQQQEKIIVDENTEFSGMFIRKIRESMGISVKDIAKTTKISTANITYIE